MKNVLTMSILVVISIFGAAFTFPNGEAIELKTDLTKEVNLGDHTTTVIIYKNGKRVGSGYKVSLGFVGGLLSGGFTKNFYTNSDGVAYIEHASEGTVKVYVDGNWSNHNTKGNAPGKIIVYL